MKTLKERTELVLELFQNSTQGLDSYFPYCTCQGDAMGGLEFARYQDVTDDDLDFIAAAPEMAQIIKEQQELLREAFNAFRFVRHRDAMWCDDETVAPLMKKLKTTV